MGYIRKYGWAPSPPDNRDYKYSPTWRADLPEVFHVSPVHPVIDQGDIGSCGPCSLAVDWFAASNGAVLPSVLFTYYATRELMGTVNQDSGVDNRTMLKAANKYGIAPDSLWPYDVAKYRQRPPSRAWEEAAKNKVESYHRVNQSILDYKRAIASGDVFLIGVQIFSNFEELDNKYRVPPPRGRYLGGHDILITGYSDNNQCFKFRNSWGDQWGDRGSGWISYDYLADPRLAGDAWTVKAKPSPAPVPSLDDPPASKGEIFVGQSSGRKLLIQEVS